MKVRADILPADADHYRSVSSIDNAHRHACSPEISLSYFPETGYVNKICETVRFHVHLW
jgi:hypothetical protein